MAKLLIHSKIVAFVIIVNQLGVLLLTNLKTVLILFVTPKSQSVQNVKNAMFVDYKTKLTKVCLPLKNH